MRNTKLLMFIKSLLLLIAIILAWFLVFVPGDAEPAEQSTVIIIDIGSGMRTQDIANEKWFMISRMTAAKEIITKIIQTSPERSFGLITCWEDIDYLVPPTLDSGTVLQYIESLVISTQSAKMQNMRTTGLIASLQDKDILSIWNIDVPVSLHAKNIWLGTDIRSLKNIDMIIKKNSTFKHFNISTTQIRRLMVLLCVIAFLAL